MKYSKNVKVNSAPEDGM